MRIFTATDVRSIAATSNDLNTKQEIIRQVLGLVMKDLEPEQRPERSKNRQSDITLFEIAVDAVTLDTVLSGEFKVTSIGLYIHNAFGFMYCKVNGGHASQNLWYEGKYWPISAYLTNIVYDTLPNIMTAAAQLRPLTRTMFFLNGGRHIPSTEQGIAS